MKRGGWLEERGSKRTTTGGSGRAFRALRYPSFWRVASFKHTPLLCLRVVCFCLLCFGLLRLGSLGFCFALSLLWCDDVWCLEVGARLASCEVNHPTVASLSAQLRGCRCPNPTMSEVRRDGEPHSILTRTTTNTELTPVSKSNQI